MDFFFGDSLIEQNSWTENFAASGEQHHRTEGSFQRERSDAIYSCSHWGARPSGDQALLCHPRKTCIEAAPPRPGARDGQARPLVSSDPITSLSPQIQNLRPPAAGLTLRTNDIKHATVSPAATAAFRSVCGYQDEPDTDAHVHQSDEGSS